MLLHIHDLRRQFPNEDVCLRYLFKEQYPSVRCPRCERRNAYHRHPTKPCFTCNCGQSHIFPKKGTLFEDSSVPLMKWFYAIFLMSTSPGGVSAKDLERALDVTYVTAWKMGKKLRAATPPPKELSGMRSLKDLITRYAGMRPKQVLSATPT